jgi:hypothetical protein
MLNRRCFAGHLLGRESSRGSDSEKMRAANNLCEGVSVFFALLVRDTGVSPVRNSPSFERISHGRDGRVTSMPRKNAHTPPCKRAGRGESLPNRQA